MSVPRRQWDGADVVGWRTVWALPLLFSLGNMVSSRAKDRTKKKSEKWGEGYAGRSTERQIVSVCGLLRTVLNVCLNKDKHRLGKLFRFAEEQTRV
jgi:hypothetical protein